LLAVPIGAFGAILVLIFLPKITNNVYAQIGLITLIGLAAKNAILIVEYAKVRVDRGEELLASTIDAVKLRLRPIVMTSLAFILGVLPLVFATGAGAVARQTIGYTVLGGMLAASSIAIFIVPVLYVLITRVSYGKKQLDYLLAHHDELMEKAKKVEEQNIDPELEFEIEKSREKDGLNGGNKQDGKHGMKMPAEEKPGSLLPPGKTEQLISPPKDAGKEEKLLSPPENDPGNEKLLPPPDSNRRGDNDDKNDADNIPEENKPVQE